jgi:hypothetical protein
VNPSKSNFRGSVVTVLISTDGEYRWIMEVPVSRLAAMARTDRLGPIAHELV